MNNTCVMSDPDDVHFEWFSMRDGHKSLEWDSETCGEKNPSHMENHTNCFFSHTLLVKTR